MYWVNDFLFSEYNCLPPWPMVDLGRASRDLADRCSDVPKLSISESLVKTYRVRMGDDFRPILFSKRPRSLRIGPWWLRSLLKLVWNCMGSSLSQHFHIRDSFSKSHRGSLVFRVIRTCSTIPKLRIIFSEIRMTWKITPDDQEMYTRIDGSSPSNFRHIPLPWSTRQESGSRTPDKKNCQSCFILQVGGALQTVQCGQQNSSELPF